MLRTLTAAAFAATAFAGTASAVTLVGETGPSGGYTIVGGAATPGTPAFSFGDELAFSFGQSFGNAGDYAGVTGGTSPFSLATTEGAANDGTTFTFADSDDVFTFEVTETEFVGTIGQSLVIFALGTIVDADGDFDPSISSLRVTVPGIFARETIDGSAAAFIATPPEGFVGVIPLPAGAPLLVLGLGALAYVRRKAA